MNLNITFNLRSRRFLAGIVILLVNFLSGGGKVYASHAAGTDLTYTYLGNNQYMIEVSFYRDCAGVNEPDSAAILYKSGCTNSFTAYAHKVAGTGLEITTPCIASATTCNGGSLTGIRRFVYRDTVTLSACADWVFSFHECCRNCAITTISNPCSSNSELYVEAKLNNLLAPGNSSPSFSNLPVAFVCVGQNFTYNHGVLDPDNDSLSYSLIAPKISASNNVSFIFPSTAISPLNTSTPFNINNITGDINFTPSALQIGVMAVLIREYRNGQLIGSVIRDMQVYTQNCSNAVPTASGINNTNSTSVTVCPDQTICFDIYSADADSLQNVTMTTNNGIAGATYTIIPGNRPTLHFCWTPTYADANLLPNTFTVTVKDNACPSNAVQTFSYSVFVPSPYFTVASTNLTCNEALNGTAEATPVYGSLYSYSWNTNPVTTTAAVTGLAAGVYTVTVNDNNQCSATASVNITQPAEISVTADGFDALCFEGLSGLIDLHVTGGTPPYSFLWSNGASTEDISSLAAGTYTVTVTDLNQCANSMDKTIGEATALFANILSTDGGCNGSLGSADLTPAGGTPPYTFAWSNGETTEDISNLAAGTYTVTITDANGCFISSGAIINTASLLNGIIFLSDVTCNGLSDGAIDLAVTGGVSPYSFAWSNGETTEDLSGLAAGVYTVTIYDAGQCSFTTQTDIIEPDAIGAAIIGSSALCNAGTGAADLTATGGTPPYLYAWSNGETTEDLQNLFAGSYTVTVTDDNGCEIVQTTLIEGAASNLSASITANNGDCKGKSTNSADLTVTGGAEPYSYLWSNGETTEDLLDIAAGTYTVTVTDGNGCITSATVTLSNNGLYVTFNASDAKCYGSNDGFILSFPSGGTAPYSFLWSNGETTQDIFNLAAGVYDLVVTDQNKCVENAKVLISEPFILDIKIVANDESCKQGGSVNIWVSGGTEPYSYLWSNGETTQNITGLAAGSYSVTVTDANGCIAYAGAVVNPFVALEVTYMATNIMLTESLGQGGSIDLTVLGGSAPYTFAWNNGETTEDLSGLPAGEYEVIVTDAQGCEGSAFIIIYDNSSTGIDEVSDNFTIMHYPNPASSEVNFIFKTDNSGQIKIELFTAQGQLVKLLFEGTVNHHGEQLMNYNVNRLSPGMYYYKVTAGKQQYNYKLLVARE